MPKPIPIPLPIIPFHETMLDGLDFLRLTYAYHQDICNQPEGFKILNERRGPVKQLVEELLPICEYIKKFYGPGQCISVCWVYGNQSFDAKMEAKGDNVENGLWPSQGTLEVTQAAHADEDLLRELLINEGGGFSLNGLQAGSGKRSSRKITSECLSYSNYSYIDEMCAIIIKAINAKIAKLEQGDYPADTTLIVDCSLTILLAPSEWADLVVKVKTCLMANNFVKIFLTADSGTHYAVL